MSNCLLHPWHTAFAKNSCQVLVYYVDFFRRVQYVLSFQYRGAYSGFSIWGAERWASIIFSLTSLKEIYIIEWNKLYEKADSPDTQLIKALVILKDYYTLFFSYRNISLNDIPNIKKRNSNCMKIKASVTLKCYYILLLISYIYTWSILVIIHDLMTFLPRSFFLP